MKNDRQIYFSGNFTSSGKSIAQPVKALDKSKGFSFIVVLGAMVMLAVVVETVLGRI